MLMSEVGFYYCFTIWKLELWASDQQNSTVFLHPYLLLCRSILRFPCGSAGKESTCNVGDLGSIPGLGRSPGEGKGYPLQYSGPENSMDCPWGRRVGHDWATLTSLLQTRINCIWLMIMYSLVIFFFPTTFVNEACSCTK